MQYSRNRHFKCCWLEELILTVQTTPIHSWHIDNKGKMVEFAGFKMPIQYEGIRQEHLHVRQKAGLFDVSHMGEFRVKGPNALKTLQWLTSNDVSVLLPGQAQYTLLMNDKGGVVDDLIIYCIEPEKDYLLCVNAANIEKDWDWISKNNLEAELINESDLWGQVALQGPEAFSVLDQLFDFKVSEMKSFEFRFANFEDEQVIVARTGYTGELGAEVFVPKNKALAFWQKIMQLGESIPVKPIGLGARDTLRTEKRFPLYGHELSDEISPYEAGLGWTVKLDAKDFLGKKHLVSEKQNGAKRKTVCFVVGGKGIARAGYKVLSLDEEEIGTVTSGTVSPSLEKNIGIALIKAEHAALGSELLVEIRKQMHKVKVIKPPFVL